MICSVLHWATWDSFCHDGSHISYQHYKNQTMFPLDCNDNQKLNDLTVRVILENTNFSRDRFDSFYILHAFNMSEKNIAELYRITSNYSLALKHHKNIIDVCKIKAERLLNRFWQWVNEVTFLKYPKMK